MSIGRTNIVLIGMPGCGKSTIGRLVAEQLARPFLDLDEEIERVAGMKLWQINETEGFAGLRRREETVATTLACEKSVIAPGGSVIYSSPAMSRLAEIGRIVHLTASADVLSDRAGDLAARGVIIRDGMTYADLLAERDPLYRHWAEVTIDVSDVTAPQAAKAVADALKAAEKHDLR